MFFHAMVLVRGLPWFDIALRRDSCLCRVLLAVVLWLFPSASLPSVAVFLVLELRVYDSPLQHVRNHGRYISQG